MPRLAACVLVAAVGLATLSGDGPSRFPFPALESTIDTLVTQVGRSGGFTVDPRDGTQPTKGFVVAMGRAGARVQPATTFFGGGGAAFLRGYLSDHAAELWTHRSRLFGAYYNRRGHRVVLSLAELVGDRATAIRLGVARQQVSVYDLASGKEVPTGYSAGLPERRKARR